MRLRISLVALLAAGCVVPPAPAPLVVPVAGAAAQAAAEAPCALSAPDQAWLDRAMDAWDYSGREITGISRVEAIEAVIFDAGCVLTSRTAMNGGPAVWRARHHGGQVPLPGGDLMPAQVTSFTSGDEKGNFFVMSSPSVWRAAGVDGQFGLETLMVAVLLHEATHVAQIPTYGARMTRLARRHRLPDSFDDDSIQERFRGNASFASSVARETDLLLAAAAATDRETALRLARDARELMKARQNQWYPAEESYLREAEDIWLTLEGSAQWAGYQWLIAPDGGAVPTAVAFPAYGKRGKWWSQEQGFALFMALNRLTGDKWKRHAFGDGAKTVLEMLDEALGTAA